MIDSASRYGIYSVSDSEGHNVGISSDQYALFQAAEPLGQELLVRRWRAEARRRY